VGLALAMRRAIAARNRPRTLLEKKAHATDVDAYWVGTYFDGLLDYLGRYVARRPRPLR
jgi:hypothetical protein